MMLEFPLTRGDAQSDRRRRLGARMDLARKSFKGQQREALCAILAALCLLVTTMEKDVKT